VRRWSFDAKARISGSSTVVNDVVYFSTFGNGTFGLDVRTGRPLWRRFEGRYSPVVATRDAFYFIGYSTLRRLRPRRHPAGVFRRRNGTVIARGGRAVARHS
jgi:outer membrane protein assembly factor BamB